MFRMPGRTSCIAFALPRLIKRAALALRACTQVFATTERFVPSLQSRVNTMETPMQAVNKEDIASGRPRKAKPITRAHFWAVFFAHLAVTLVAGFLLLPIGGFFFEVTPPNLETYFFLSVYGLIGFPLLDFLLLHISKNVELCDALGNYWLL